MSKYTHSDHMVKATNQSRALYDQLRSKYPNENQFITDSYLTLWGSLQGTTSVVQFNVLINSNTQFPVENRLNITDRFCVKDWAMVITKTGSATTLPTAAEIQNFVPYTYPNLAVFSGTNEQANLESVYNGYTRVVIDSKVYYQAYPNRNFYRVPQSQKGTTSAAIAGPVQYKIDRDGWDSMNYAFAPVYPTFEFNGLGKNEVSLNIQNSTATLGTTSYNSCFLICRGFLIQNVNQPR